MKSHLFITKLAVQSQLWKLEIWETSQIPFIQNIHIEKKKGEKKAFSTSQINHYIAPCRRLSGWYLVPCVINTDKKKKNPAHTSSGVIFTSSTLRMFQPANLPPPKRTRQEKEKKGGKCQCFPLCELSEQMCAERREAGNNLALREIKASKWALLTLQHWPIWSWRC